LLPRLTALPPVDGQLLTDRVARFADELSDDK